MHEDQQLRTMLRRIDRASEPDPVFSDALFRQLTLASRSRTSRASFFILAAALLLAAVAGGIVVGSGLVQLPWFSVDANPVLPSDSPAPASQGPSGTTTPAPSFTTIPSATPSPTPSAPAPDPEIRVGTVVAPVVDGVTLRESPGTGGTRIGTLALGSINYVVDGPVDADGYTWYQLSGPGLPPAAGCITPVPTDPLECPTWFGWAAVADPSDQSPWFTPTNVDCPDPADQTDDFIGLQNILVLPCYGGAELTFVAYLAELPEGGVGGTNCTRDAIIWLYCADQLYYQVTARPDAAGMSVYIDPSSGLTLPDRGTWLRITGAFDHPDAPDCAAGAMEDTKRVPLPDPELAVLLCRTHFVPTAVATTTAP
jgi:hypothetical protein